MSETPVATMQRLAANTRVGYSFEQEFYTSDAVFKADMDRVISQKWILAGHVSKVENKGDYFLFRIGAEQIIIIRENVDSVRAFFNVCRHRGSTLCQAESGNAPRLVCPYHAWTFGLDGRLISARLLHLFVELNRLGTTVLIATHDLKLVQQARAPVLHLERGVLSVS